MGTNYYLRESEPCPTCGRHYEERHIGKSRSGWVFLLHVYPDEGIDDFEDWRSLLGTGTIYNEYGEVLTTKEMLSIIRNRIRPYRPNLSMLALDERHFMVGPNNLIRHRIDGRHCIGHGEGTYDYFVGEFS